MKRHPTYEKIINIAFSQFHAPVLRHGLHLATIRREVRRIAVEEKWNLPKYWIRSLYKRLLIMETEGKLDEVIKLKFKPAQSKTSPTKSKPIKNLIKQKVSLRKKIIPKKSNEIQDEAGSISLSEMTNIELEDYGYNDYYEADLNRSLTPPPTSSELETVATNFHPMKTHEYDEFLDELHNVLNSQLKKYNDLRIEDIKERRLLEANYEEILKTSEEKDNFELVAESIRLANNLKTLNIENYRVELEESIKNILYKCKSSINFRAQNLDFKNILNEIEAVPYMEEEENQILVDDWIKAVKLALHYYSIDFCIAKDNLTREKVGFREEIKRFKSDQRNSLQFFFKNLKNYCGNLKFEVEDQLHEIREEFKRNLNLKLDEIGSILNIIELELKNKEEINRKLENDKNQLEKKISELKTENFIKDNALEKALLLREEHKRELIERNKEIDSLKEENQKLGIQADKLVQIREEIKSFSNKCLNF